MPPDSAHKRILIVTEAWPPQINGVVRTLENTIGHLRRMGHDVRVVSPRTHAWLTLRAPIDPSIRLEFFGRRRVEREIEGFNPDYIHIATEGTLGWSARNACLRLQKPFTTSYHTRYPEYLDEHAPPLLRDLVKLLTYAVLRRFHAPSSAVMVPTASIERSLHARRFRRIVRWSRGVDLGAYQLYGKDVAAYQGLRRPILLNVGRVAAEKNLRAFLAASTPGTKVIIGDGPQRMALQKEFPGAVFLGFMEGEELARHYAAADVFVFPSETDTFGLVLLEAAAAGLRVAGTPSPGPSDIFADPEARTFAVLDADLGRAIRSALALPDAPEEPRRFAERFTWAAGTQQFFDHLQAQTPQAVRRLTRIRNVMQRLALRFK